MYLEHRREFPKLIDELEIRSAVEVGAAEGYFSRALLQSKSLQVLWLVDPWDNEAYWLSVQMLAEEDGRVRLFRGTSEAAARELTSFDFAYLDAVHEYEFIRQDIDLWLPKTKKCIAGHDWAFYNSVAGAPNGVVLAVEETFGDRALATGVTARRVERLRAAYDATTKRDYGKWAEDVPSWYVILEDK